MSLLNMNFVSPTRLESNLSQAIAILGFLLICLGLYKDDVRVYSRKWVYTYLAGFVVMCLGIGFYVAGF